LRTTAPMRNEILTVFERFEVVWPVDNRADDWA
jgi:hypothetical protein